MNVRPILRKLALSMGALVAFGVLGEVTARLLESGPMSLYDTNPYQPDAVLGHVHKPDFSGRWDSTWYATNSHGWRGPELTATREDGELRVVALGDSCTFGKGVLEVETWPRVLETKLATSLPAGNSLAVFNLGVNGYATSEYLHVLETQGLALHPDLVVVGYNINDFPNPIRTADNQVFHADGRPDSWRGRLRRWLGPTLRDELNRLALYRFARATYYDMSRERDYAQMEAIAQSKSSEDIEGLEAGFEKEVKLLERLVESANSEGAKVAIFLFPYESMVYLKDSNRGPEERVRAMAEALGIGYIDVPAAFRTAAQATTPPIQLFVRGDRYHPNAAGYALTAETLAIGLRAMGWPAAND